MNRTVAVAFLLLFPAQAMADRQSILHPAGEDAFLVAELFWWMLGGAIVLWVMVNGLFIYITRLNPVPLSRRLAEALIIGGGVVLPTVLLAGLLAYTLQKIPMHTRPGDGLTVKITGEQWWWRVEYWPEGATDPIVTANEIRLPAGERTDFRLTAAKVIHSFWVPALGGKLDMFPGAETRMSLLPETPGVYRGQCAEFCGTSHALMAFEAVVLEPDEFEEWLAAEAAPAVSPVGEEAARGQEVFFAEGCAGCHAVRGTEAIAQIGPNLTHFGSRKSLAAGILPITDSALAEWISHPGEVKPDAFMPDYDYLPPDDLSALATYLRGLK